jgi:hypothetical protein
MYNFYGKNGRYKAKEGRVKAQLDVLRHLYMEVCGVQLKSYRLGGV